MIQADFIIGKQLMQVIINRFSIDLIFENGIYIDVESSIIYHVGGTDIIRQWDSINNPPFAINEILEKVVISVKVGEDENLTIEFEDHGRLIIKADKYGSDSYSIRTEINYREIFY